MISVVINTWNEGKNLERAVSSVKDLASEIIVVDMQSSDSTRDIAKKLGAKVIMHKYTGYVEPARNFAIEKAKGPWIFILDADEEVPDNLAKKIEYLAKNPDGRDFFRIPRKNIIFGQWIRHARWWPDHNIRFFRKGSVVWSEIIHSVPETHGVGWDLPSEERLAIIHHHYQTISQYLERSNRYTTIQAELKVKNGYTFSWRDLIAKPTGEFLSRFFVGEAYKDGIHGLALSLLQAFSEVQVYLKTWELEKFKPENLEISEVENELTKTENELDHWLIAKKFRRPSILRKILHQIPR